MKILVVDDMSFARDFIRQNLDHLGFEGEIHNANSLKSAQDELQKSIKEDKLFTILIFDLVLTDGESTDLVKKLRKSKSYKNIPIILMTTEENRGSILKAINSGVNEYIFKPVDPIDLATKINKYF